MDAAIVRLSGMGLPSPFGAVQKDPIGSNYVNLVEKSKRGKEAPGLSFYLNCIIQKPGS
jgi:hypothetical protein